MEADINYTLSAICKEVYRRVNNPPVPLRTGPLYIYTVLMQDKQAAALYGAAVYTMFVRWQCLRGPEFCDFYLFMKTHDDCVEFELHNPKMQFDGEVIYLSEPRPVGSARLHQLVFPSGKKTYYYYQPRKNK